MLDEASNWGAATTCDQNFNGYNDTQHMGYVLRASERTVPAGLQHALQVANQLQDIVMAEMQPGRSGNDVLAAALGRMREAGIDGTVYTHPIGDRGHA